MIISTYHVNRVNRTDGLGAEGIIGRGRQKSALTINVVALITEGGMQGMQ